MQVQPIATFRILVFNNGGSADWWNISALCECGRFVAGHVCSHEGYARHDMGFTSNWKHDAYNAHAAEHHGSAKWELVWVPTDEMKARSNAEIEAAYKRHLALTSERDAAEARDGR